MRGFVIMPRPLSCRVGRVSVRGMTSAAPQAGWSLRQRLTLILLRAALVPVLVFGAALLWSQWQRDRDDMQLRITNNAQLSANALDDFLQGHLSGVEVLAGGTDGSLPDDGARLERLLHAYPSMLRALIADAQGRVVTARGASGELIVLGVQQMAGREWYVQARNSGEPWVSDGYRSKVFGPEPVVAVSAPLQHEGVFSGVLQGAIPVEALTRLPSDNLRRRGFELLVLDRKGRVVHASAGLRWKFLDNADPIGSVLRRKAAPAGQVGPMQQVSGLLRDGRDAYVSSVFMHTGWMVTVIAPQPSLMASALPRLALLLGLLVVVTVGVLVAWARLRRLLDKSMGRLLASLHGYALGGTLDPAQMSRMPEELQPIATGIGELAARMNAAFGELRRVIEQREHEIDERTASLQKAVGELDRLSRTDGLTGALNYRGFQEAGEALFNVSTASGKPLSVLALDIDYFKRYNDRYGHLEGDSALRRFAGAVRSALLHADDLLARPGGEEFIVFLPNATAEQARGVAERVTERVRSAEILHEDAPGGRLTVSVGVATVGEDDADIEDVLRRADDSLYQAKQAGRDRVGR